MDLCDNDPLSSTKRPCDDGASLSDESDVNWEDGEDLGSSSLRDDDEDDEQDAQPTISLPNVSENGFSISLDEFNRLQNSEKASSITTTTSSSKPPPKKKVRRRYPPATTRKTIMSAASRHPHLIDAATNLHQVTILSCVASVSYLSSLSSDPLYTARVLSIFDEVGWM